MKKHRGTIVPMITPVTADGALDEQAAERLVARLADHGLGVFVLGTTGEASSAPVALGVRLTEIAVAGAKDRVPVYAGIGHNCPAESVAAAERYLRAGVDAVVAHLPSYYALEPAEMQAYFESLAQQIDGPLVIYNMPQTTHMMIPLDVVEKLTAVPTIIALKDSANDVPRMTEVAKRFGGRDDFSIFMGVALLSVQALRAGFDGLVPSSGAFVARMWQEFDNACAKGDWDEAGKLQQRFDEIAQVLQRGRTLGQSLAALKVAVATDGTCEPHMLPPLQALSAAEAESIRTQLAAIGAHP